MCFNKQLIIFALIIKTKLRIIMSKCNKINAKHDSVKSIPLLLKNKKNYQLLISNRSINFRRILIEKLDDTFNPELGYNTWKNRFLYPETNIPKKNFEEISTLMEKYLAQTLQKQVEYLREEKKDIERIIAESEKAIKTYRDEKLKTLFF